MSPPSFTGITKIHLEKNAKMQFHTLKIATTSQGTGRSEVKFVDKVPLTPSNAPTKFRWNNQNKFREKCKKAILDP